ncbi:hypothetical protein AMEX_G15174 [Astyanax mexicanus]|uniref:HECT domain-containing protein n=1 Tax=Astyanax mexicanus TaxID=7994 RepID=A0A8T2LFE7_ASTMX|nr:hypothetical protein AMEX_G15174 [Astyanax mexicanus]
MNPNEGNADVVRSARHLLSLLTSQSGSAAGPSQENARQQFISVQGERAAVQTEMARSFPGFFTKGRGKKRFCAAAPVPCKPAKIMPLTIYLLPHQYDRTPKEEDQLLHMQAGLGRRTAYMDENATHEEICAQLKELYPKLKELTGGWLIYKASGGWGTRKLTLVTPDDGGYCSKLLKTASQNGKGILYIAPLQMELDTSPLPPTSGSFSGMPKEKCQKCGVFYPLVILPAHIKSCEVINLEDDQNVTCPICEEEMPLDILEIHASSCKERVPPVDSLSQAGPSIPHTSSGNVTLLACNAEPSNATHDTCMNDYDWKTHPDPERAATLYSKGILRFHETGKPFFMNMDLRMSKEDQDRELLALYKQSSVEWGCPVTCKLQGDVAVGEGVTRYLFSALIQRLKAGFTINLGNAESTCLFEGEPDHLVPSSSQFLIEGDLFLVAGRMLGHSFLHGGPRLSGLSRAIVHVLVGDSPETATVQIEDCPDHDIREIIKLLDGDAELSDDERKAVLDLCLSWDLPGPTNTNRRWLFERLLWHAVIGRRLRQLKQIRNGLKETKVWSLLIERKDVQIFPKESEYSLTPQILLPYIRWPTENSADEDDDDDCPLENKCRISGYFRQFIETASSPHLKELVKFWIGWEVPSGDMAVEIINGLLPKSSTCFCTLRLPGHYTSYSHFQEDLLSCIGTSDFGFGII